MLRIGTILIAAFAAQAAPKAQFLSRTVTLNGVAYRYVVSIPGDWSADRTWPIILFLHGSAQIGEDGVAQSKVGLGHAVRKHPERFPAIVVMPQCRRGAGWTAPEMEAQTLAALDASTREFNGDPQRTYLTGLSMGGYGAWSLAAKYPDRFAAVVVICGGIVWPAPQKITDEAPYAAIARQVAGIPIWVFHGNADRTVFVTESREMVKLLRDLQADVRYTEYNHVPHQSWDRAYGERKLPAWLFAQKR